MTKTTNEVVDRKDANACVVDKPMAQQLDELIAGMDEHLLDLRDSYNRANAQMQDKKALCALLPSTLPLAPKSIRVTGSAYNADADIEFEIGSREQALQLLAVLPGVEVVMVNAGTTTFLPQERFTPSPHGIDKVQPIAPLVYRLSTWVNKVQEEYSWWTKLGDKLVRILAKNQKTPKARVSANRRVLVGQLVETIWTYTDLPKGVVTRWHGGSAKSMMPLTVHVPRETAIPDAYADTMAATARVSSSQCEC